MPTETEKIPKVMPHNKSKALTTIGIALIAMSLVVLAVIFFPILREETNYQIHKGKYRENIENTDTNDADKNGQLVPNDPEFSIIIPKIGINSRIMADVNAEDAREYQRKLAEGVAHAKGSAHPGEVGDIFLFAHSGANLDEALRFNAVFYLLNKLEINDQIYIFYKGERYSYKIVEKGIASPDDLHYENPSEDPELVLMTCWPPGTTLKRLIVKAR